MILEAFFLVALTKLLPRQEWRYSKETLVPHPLGCLLRQWTPRGWNFSRNLTLGKGKDQSRRNCLPKEISLSSDNLSDPSAGQTGADTVTGQWWAGPQLYQDSLALHAYWPSIEAHTSSQDPKDGFGGGVGLLCSFINVITLNSFPFSFSYYSKTDWPMRMGS